MEDSPSKPFAAPLTDPALFTPEGDSVFWGPGETESPFKASLDNTLANGYAWLRFPPALEVAYQRDKAPERRRTLERGGICLLVLFNLMLVTDWMIVPDQFALAVGLRLFFFTSINVIGLLLTDRFTPRSREWTVVAMSVLAAAITAALCLQSHDRLAAPYLVSLVMVVLFNGSVIRTPFWKALLIDALVMVIFVICLMVMPNPDWHIMAALLLVLFSTAVFTLYSSYWLEHEDRTNWLMQGQEHHLLEALGKANRRLERMSRFDALTDLANRRHFDEFVAQLWQRARRSGQAIALLMMDVDHFKAYNDHYGHPKGDTCLQQIAALLKRQLRRPGDLVARFGGEEFVAVLHDTALPQAVAAAERVRAGVQTLGLPHAASPTAAQVTISIGVSALTPKDAEAGPPALIAASDAALYRAKSQGRNQVVPASAMLTPVETP